MSMRDMICVIEMIDVIQDFHKAMDVLVGSTFRGNSISSRIDGIYELIRNNAYEGLDVEDEEKYEKLLEFVDDNSIDKEVRAKYVLTGEM